MNVRFALALIIVVVGLATAAAAEIALTTRILGESRTTGRGRAEPSPFADAFGAAVADRKAGRKLFFEAGCAGCHTLAAAGARGRLGPNLDVHLELHPHRFRDIVEIVARGRGTMPAYEDRLSPTQISNVPAFVPAAAKSPRAPTATASRR